MVTMTSWLPKPNLTTTTKSFTIRLPPDECAGEHGALDIEDGESVDIHLLFGVQGHHVLAGANQRSDLRQDSTGHRPIVPTPQSRGA